jgi:hypothetical protein
LGFSSTVLFFLLLFLGPTQLVFRISKPHVSPAADGTCRQPAVFPRSAEKATQRTTLPKAQHANCVSPIVFFRRAGETNNTLEPITVARSSDQNFFHPVQWLGEA